jgi:hypothetical protein
MIWGMMRLLDSDLLYALSGKRAYSERETGHE